MVKSLGIGIFKSVDQFKAELRKHVAELHAQGFFQSDAAHQKALINIESLSEADWKTREEVRRDGIDKVN